MRPSNLVPRPPTVTSPVTVSSGYEIRHRVIRRTTCLFRRHFCNASMTHPTRMRHNKKRPGTAPESFYTKQFFGTVPRLPVPRLPPGASLGSPKILATGAKLHLGPRRLHVENWKCRALKSSARCQKSGVPCPFLARANGVLDSGMAKKCELFRAILHLVGRSQKLGCFKLQKFLPHDVTSFEEIFQLIVPVITRQELTTKRSQKKVFSKSNICMQYGAFKHAS